ncbi:hypothetical protein FDT80_17570 [Sulfitobacter sabulilitoris]|uniref:Uncharacterized protein n=1 Tax=Sulfitobacter sabulilitoris TaxID=2562655 RepID=A0A5S3P7X8_9RHOB|nr:hypothetical protein FDT80_17570 [Sulfitobacter sabulilitoris]
MIPEFATAAGVVGLTGFSRGLPDAAVGHILECALNGPPGRMDYSIALLRRGPSFARLHEALLSGSANLGKTAQVLSLIDTDLALADVLWLEFDMERHGGMSLPSFFVGSASPDPEAAASMARSLFGAIWPGIDAPDVTALLRKLPSGVFLRQAGVMASRDAADGPCLRLVLDGVPGDGVREVLRRLRWPGHDDVAHGLAGFADRHVRAGPCRIDVDLGNGLAPSLGVELPCSSFCADHTAGQDLHAAGLASGDKAKALNKLTPRRTIGPKTGPAGAERLDFGLNHIKLKTDGEAGVRKIEAKAYFSLVATPDFESMRPEHEGQERLTEE